MFQQFGIWNSEFGIRDMCDRAGRGPISSWPRSIPNSRFRIPNCVLATSVLLTTVLLLGCRAKQEPEPTRVVTVDVAPVLLSTIQRTIRTQGLLYPRQQAAIVPKVSAPIRKASVQRGARVRAGQLLLELENRDLAGS